MNTPEVVPARQVALVAPKTAMLAAGPGGYALWQAEQDLVTEVRVRSAEVAPTCAPQSPVAVLPEADALFNAFDLASKAQAISGEVDYRAIENALDVLAAASVARSQVQFDCGKVIAVKLRHATRHLVITPVYRIQRRRPVARAARIAAVEREAQP